MDTCPTCGKPVFRWQYAELTNPLSTYCLGHLTITMHQASGTAWGVFVEPVFDPPEFYPYERVAVPQVFVDAFSEEELCP